MWTCLRYPSIGRHAVLLALTSALLAACATSEPLHPSAQSITHAPTLEPILAHAEAALRSGDHAAAARQFQLALSKSPNEPRAKLGLAELHLADGQRDQAASLFAAAEAEPSLRALALQGQGLAAMLGPPDERNAARAFLARAVEADPSLWRAWNALGRAHDDEGEWDAAKIAYERAIALTPNAPEPHNNLGFSLLRQRKFKEAVGPLTRATMLARQSEVPRANLRLALAWDGRYAEAVAGAQPRELANVLNNVGYVALLKGDHKQAEAYLTRAMETSASHHDHAWHNLNHLVTAKGQDADGAPTPLR